MPPELKMQIRYSKMNRLALSYARVTVVVVLVLAGIFGAAVYWLGQQTEAISSDVASKQKEIARISQDFLPKAQDASERLNAIKYVQDTQTNFSLLIADLSKALPKEVYITDLTLTGDDTKPVSISAIGKTYNEMLALRNSLVSSPRIAGADIVSLKQVSDTDTSWTATVVVGFKPGQAK
jgi:Tfp pilus assembly protein PilN